MLSRCVAEKTEKVQGQVDALQADVSTHLDKVLEGLNRDLLKRIDKVLGTNPMLDRPPRPAQTDRRANAR
jgi:hypothetical protein